MLDRFWLLSLLLVTSCGKPATPAPTPSLPLIIGHRGGSGVAPENTLASFKAAFAQGADGIEGDYHLTKDGEIACLHDATTDRVAGVSRVVRDCTLAELRELDVGAWKGEAFRGEKIPTLPEVLALIPAGKLIFVEIKCGPEIVPKLVDTLRAGPVRPDRITLISFNQEVVRQFKIQSPAISAFWLVDVKPAADGTPPPAASSIIATLQQIRADGVGLSAKPAVDAGYLGEIKRAGFQINVWTVNTPDVAHRFVGLGVDSITTDVPGPLREALVSVAE